MRRIAGFVLVAGLCLAGPVLSQPARQSAAPRLEPVAETKLLMEGLAKPNFDAVCDKLKDKPADNDTWQLARGQALLLAETGNLLLIRPPKTRQAQDTWLARAGEFRTAASQLARAAGDRDYTVARAAVAAVTNTCNRCHESFRVPVRLTPFANGQ